MQDHMKYNIHWEISKIIIIMLNLTHIYTRVLCVHSEGLRLYTILPHGRWNLTHLYKEVLLHKHTHTYVHTQKQTHKLHTKRYHKNVVLRLSSQNHSQFGKINFGCYFVIVLLFSLV
ncbi:hypothetical protein LDENG_00196300 [Lucifuga dentata]|nr:hypothetical protein LDENG_00196300 [Lucifuga dentata]